MQRTIEDLQKRSLIGRKFDFSHANSLQYDGLSNVIVKENRRKYGENTLTPPPKTNIWILLLQKFTDPLIIILLIALVLSIFIAFYEFFATDADTSVFLEPLGILISILLATLVAFFFEQSAHKKFEILNKVNDDAPVKVIRNHGVCQVPKKEIVVDDLVVLETGDDVPADGKLIESTSLQVNESTLTGEPLTKKSIDPKDFADDATYPTNHLMRGSTVIDGHAILQIIKVGDDTEYGKVYKGAQIDNSIKTPLNQQLEKLAKKIAVASYIIASLIICLRLINYSIYIFDLNNPNWLGLGGYFLNTIMIAITLIVVAVPEGLPMSVTLSLALSMKRMLATNNLVRKLHACETMGAATVICTDKTGTLTLNKMEVYDTKFYKYHDIADEIKEGIAVNSTAFLDFSNPNKKRALGNPTEGALLFWLHDHRIDYFALRQAEIVEQLTFSTERKYMATVVRSPLLKQTVLYVKGAPEIVLNFCNTLPAPQEEITKHLLSYQNRAMRTLGFAYCIVDPNKSYLDSGKIADNILTFLGIVAISDPLRPTVPEEIKNCLNAGIDVKIVTGDTPATAKEIGRQIGLWDTNEPDDHHLTGVDFEAIDDNTLLTKILNLKILSRARPMDKQRLVRLLQQKEQVVAVTGDGTNDAPALKAAQVGLSMGDGTSVAKEASDITIIDNSFTSISRAVMWGRSLYQNIQRFILFQMTINVVACLIVLIGSFLGTESPLTVTQMLWVNLIMDTFAALALASLPPTNKVMKDKPRKATDFIITKPMWIRILSVGVFFVALLFSLLQYFKHFDVISLTNFSFKEYITSLFNFSAGKGLSPYELSLFFTTFVFLQFWNLFNVKAFMTDSSTFKDMNRSGGFLLIAVIILAGQWLIVTLGNGMFNVMPLYWEDWLIIIGATSFVLWTGEILRLVRK
ncbi:MAG: calcium-translocating P-type ATPase, PMCA-type [Tannerellaceae bacterium]|jgi:Ca2+-transporting ATPase|nr:calcium-translocating P-type ATPase, PMCA-type [Tannerellaceae bacterium]